MPASTLLHGQYGVEDVCREGAEIPIQEQEALKRSAGVLRGVLDRVRF